ncbi:MAG: Ribonuclease Y [Microgenomates bacterium 39_7]|nr:MAG: Ribonuclease Y [Microgenomates bacterium 39_7]
MAFFNNLSTLFSREPKKKEAKQSPKSSSQKQTVKKPQVSPQVKKVSQPPKVDPQELAREKESLLREAKAQAREIVVEAKDTALQIKAKIEQTARKQEQELTQRTQVLDSKIDKLDQKLDEINRKEEALNRDRANLNELKEKIDSTKVKMLQRLEEISGMTQQEAKNALLEGVEKQLTHQLAALIRQKEEEAQVEAKDKAQEIIIESMRHGATDYVAEYTVSVVDIPSEDVKGKIIGKSGRNIHAFERKTGVDLDLDYSDKEVRLSCFDPVRREIARISLERLIKDGRIQPVRIEQVVDKVKQEIDQIMIDAGKDLCQRVGVYNLPHDLIKILGRFKYRFSYGQNMVKHTLEETKIGIKIAHELGLDVNVVKLGCLLHDVGKVSENADENHVQAGVKIAKKFNMPQEVIDCIAQHHEDEPFTSPEAMAVYVADAISGARPGARYENIDEYFERLQNLEQIATSHSEVEEAYAVKAGREVRVLLNPEKSKDDDVVVLANKIKEKIENKLTYPGSVTINVIRESRHTATAN